jgi:hypothetical protein
MQIEHVIDEERITTKQSENFAKEISPRSAQDFIHAFLIWVFAIPSKSLDGKADRKLPLKVEGRERCYFFQSVIFRPP